MAPVPRGVGDHCGVQRDATLGAQLAALESQIGAPSFEVLVMDNNSSDDVGSLVARHSGLSASVVPATRHQGQCYARNLGVLRARGEHILICDQDDVGAPGWVRAMHEELSQRAVLATGIASTSRSSTAPPRPAPTRGTPKRRSALPGCRATCRSSTAAILGIRREDYLRLGGMDNSLPRRRRGHGLLLAGPRGRSPSRVALMTPSCTTGCVTTRQPCSGNAEGTAAPGYSLGLGRGAGRRSAAQWMSLPPGSCHGAGPCADRTPGGAGECLGDLAGVVGNLKTVAPDAGPPPPDSSRSPPGEAVARLQRASSPKLAPCMCRSALLSPPPPPPPRPPLPSFAPTAGATHLVDLRWRLA